MGTYGADARTDRHTDVGHDLGIDWAASCRLALVVSLVAAIAALGLVAVVGETTAIVTVIVAATAVSWFQLEQGQLTRRPAVIRHD